ncbi:PEP-CTERM sorting domain-containing protein [Roseateles cavernae]|uniref:PEP-CTERM sorting domain-containing protein n=1 Tax=Roseateles cavernae TaxID=3153578 RepID=UPI0032E3D85A
MNTSRHLFWPLRPLATLAAGLLTALSLSLVATPKAHAVPVTYSFVGVVDWDEAQRGWSSFAGSFSFDSQAVDGIADGSTAAYAHAGAPWGMSVSFDGGAHVAAYQQVFNVLISDNLGGSDQFGALAQNAAGTQSLQLTLWDFAAQVFGSDALPLPDGGLALADFQWSSFSYESSAGILQGRLADFGCTSGCSPASPVPEPGSLALALAGLGLLLTRRTARMG